MTMAIGNAGAMVLALTRELGHKLEGTPYRSDIEVIARRLAGPLHVAIAGRVKAGKSTLLNALVGERLAPTDAGECTRLVSWYRRGQRYEVAARLRNGQDKALEFRRDEGALNVMLNGVPESDVQFLDVRWPASALEKVTLIDTPGLASLNDENSRRTREFLDHDGDHAPDADAVIYLMRHLHRSDVEFLDAFMDRSVSAASPVNAVAVLSRGDEIGAGRLDAMESAERIARRYRNDDDVHSLCATVVPMAGLLAETGLTLRESEAASLREVASTPAEELELMLLSAEQFCDLHTSQLTVEIRRNLIDRLGMYGLRVAVQEVRSGSTTAASLGPKLVARSGLNELNRVIAEHFLPRARVLQARSALVAIRGLARRVRTSDPQRGDYLDREAERIEAGAVDFARIRAAHMLASGGVRVSDADRTELEHILLAPTAEAALGMPGGSSGRQLASGALQVIERWRSRSADPLADPALVEVCEAAARTGEAIYGAAQHTEAMRR
jgi:hypothetical protein